MTYAHPESLVSTEWLAQHLEAPDLRVVDASWYLPAQGKNGRAAPVYMRRACNPRLREVVHHWANVAAQHDPRTKQHYARLRAVGHSHGRALRGVADRLLAMLVAMLKRGELYDPGRRVALAA